MRCLVSRKKCGSRIRVRPRTARRSAGAVSARSTAAASPPSSACSCATWSSSRSPAQGAVSRDKLLRSVEIATRKRNVDPERIERAVTGIVRQLESSGETEVTSEEIGQLVMEALKSLDDIAYVRFASVYRISARPRTFTTCSARCAATRTPASHVRASRQRRAGGYRSPLHGGGDPSSRSHEGLTSTNPSVATLIVRDDGAAR